MTTKQTRAKSAEAARVAGLLAEQAGKIAACHEALTLIVAMEPSLPDGLISLEQSFVAVRQAYWWVSSWADEVRDLMSPALKQEETT